MFYTVRQQLIVWDRITAAKFIANGQQRPVDRAYGLAESD